jgi:hypothetical protein
MNGAFGCIQRPRLCLLRRVKRVAHEDRPMLRSLSFASVFALTGIVSPAAAQSWGFGVEVGPGYYGPPVYYERVRPRFYHGQPPVVLAPAPHVFHMVAPDDVLDELEDAGYRELSPMRRRGRFYLVNAVDPDGNLVALEVSIFTGEIERARILEARHRAPPRFAAPRAASPRVARTAPQAAPPARARALPETARVPMARPEPQPTQAAAAPNPALPTPQARTRTTPSVPPGQDEPSALRDRLSPAPEEPLQEERDPLVVY